MTGIDEHLREIRMDGELREYRVTINGNETTMQLNEDEAERLGGAPVEDATDSGGAKARGAANKARGAQTK